jgi:phosphoribosylaminoimidazole-succinocarboxamide synthase
MTATVTTTDISALKPFIRGKVRDVYDLGDRLLIVTTDRISAFDVVLPNPIPDKGRVLTQISAFWFGRMQDYCPNHLISTELEPIQAAVREAGAEVPAEVIAGRTMLVKKVQALPVECIVRGYLEGSGWKEYQRSGSVCGISLPSGLQQASQLPEPIFTPSTKSLSGHDENITHEQMAERVAPDVMERLITLSVEVYRRAAEYARERGIIIADTKFEFGLADGEVIMIDECLTPDSSRFWDAALYKPGGAQVSFDKQPVRDHLDRTGWNHEPPPPVLPDEVVRATSERYREIYRRLTGHDVAEAV